MNRAQRLGLFGGLAVLIGVLMVVIVSRSHTSDASGAFEMHSLTGMSADEIGEYAVAWTKANGEIVVNGTPHVSASRQLESGDLAGFGDNGPTDSTKYLVILQGDFLVTPGAGGPTIAINPKPVQGKYLLEVFNKDGGLDTFGSDPTGAHVKRILGDAALPGLPPTETSTVSQPPIVPTPPAPMMDHPPTGPNPGWTTPPTPEGSTVP